MQVPKPLLILIVVLLVLGVVGCSAGFLRGGDRDRSPDQKKDDVRGTFVAFLDVLIPDPEPVRLGPLDATCFSGDRSTLVFGGSCEVRITPTGDLRRQLQLRVAPGNRVNVEVFQPADGDALDDQDVPFVDDGQSQDSVAVVVRRDESARIVLSCILGCTVSLS
jgi:hypothetical protein